MEKLKIKMSSLKIALIKFHPNKNKYKYKIKSLTKILETYYLFGIYIENKQ